MTRRFSTAGDASKALVVMLAARPGLAGVQIEWGWPGEGRSQPDLIWVGEVESTDQDPAAWGNRRRDERYRISVWCDAVRPTSGTPADASARGWALAREVEELVADDPQLGESVGSSGFAQIAGVEAAATIPVTESAYQSVVRVDVGVRARI